MAVVLIRVAVKCPITDANIKRFNTELEYNE